MLEQNDEERVWETIRSRVISQGDAKIMSYAEVVKAKQKRAAEADTSRVKASAKCKGKADSRMEEPKSMRGGNFIPPCPKITPVAKTC